MNRPHPRRLLAVLTASCLLSGLPAGCDQGAAPPAASTEAPAAEQPASTPPATTTAPPAANPPRAIVSGPRITFASLTHDFGVITDSQTYTTHYEFTNTGDANLVIRDVKAACGCTVPTLRRTYRPGESGELEVVFDPKGKKDVTRKTIKVMSNSADSGVTELEFTSMIKPLLAIDRMQRLGTIPIGTDHRVTVPVFYTDPDLEFRNLSVNDDHIHAYVSQKGNVDHTDEDGVVYRADIEVTVSRDKSWGVLFAKKLTIDVNGRWRPDAEPIDFTYDIFLMGNVFGKIWSRPGLIALGQISPGAAFSKSLALYRPDREAFKVTDVRIAEGAGVPGMTVRAEPKGVNAYDIIVEGTAGRHGSFRGRIEVETDVQGEELIDFPFTGHVR